MKKKLILFVLVSLIISVVFIFQEHNKPSIGFYHWKSNYKNSQDDKYKKYIKVLDFQYDKKLMYISTTFHDIPNDFIPIVYIDNKVFKESKSNKTIINIIKRTLDKFKISFNEVQFDCDWTNTTKNQYFTFLSSMKDLLKSNISATIRLHQIKYFELTGIPPVDYGVLMFYNMASISDINTKNYILDLNIAKQYMYNFDIYPLKLDIALPIYSMATIIRYGKVVAIKDNVKSNMLKNDKFIKLEDTLYKSLKTHYFYGTLVYKNDIIRIDEVNENILLESYEMLLKKLRTYPKNIIFYRYDNINNFSKSFYSDLVKKSNRKLFQ